MALSLTIPFDDDEAVALRSLLLDVFGDDRSETERMTDAATAAKECLRQWLVTRKIDLDQMMLAAKWEPHVDHESVVARTEDFRDAMHDIETEQANAAAIAALQDKAAERAAILEQPQV